MHNDQQLTANNQTNWCSREEEQQGGTGNKAGADSSDRYGCRQAAVWSREDLIEKGLQ